MIDVRRLPPLLAAALVVCALVVFSAPALAQLAMPSAEQLDMLRSLSPEERNQIMQQLGIGGSGSSSSSSTQDQSSQRATERQHETRSATDEEIAEGMRAQSNPLLLPLDTIVIEIELPGVPLPPRPAQPSALQYPYSQMLLPGALQGGGTAQLQQQLLTPQAAQQSPIQVQQPPSRFSTALPADEQERLKPLIALVQSRNPYRLTREGLLELPGFRGIALAGLTEAQATLRLQSEPGFHDLQIRITKLPLQRIASEGLKPFGYDLFDQGPSTFAPINDVPVPSEYVIGPGDQLSVQLYGTQNRTLRLKVGSDGRISFPDFGPIEVGGRTFGSISQSIEDRVARQMIGVHASVSMADTRSIRVFVLGDARSPGSYTVSGLSTIVSALYAAGGIKTIGSMRDIQLKRAGQVIRHLDLYDLLLRGSTADDSRLLPGDVIFIPPVGETVSVYGEVRRPAIYEVRSPTNIEGVLSLAGGLTAEADVSKASITRIGDDHLRRVRELDVSTASARAEVLHNGDLIRITRLRPTLDAGITLQGYLYSEGPIPYHAGMRLSEAIPSVDDLRPNADIHYLLIRREMPPDRRIVAVSADLAAALRAPGGADDPVLMPRDRIMVFDLEPSRQRLIQPVLDELRLQSTIEHPNDIVHIEGRVKAPGDYPLEPSMTVSALLRAGGSLTDAAYAGGAELTRYNVVNGEMRKTEVLTIDLGKVLRGDSASDIHLQPFDSLSIKEVSEWSQQEGVELAGEVRFPGTYTIKRGETLKSVIRRAGGLTQYAFPAGSVFVRQELKNREQEQIDRLTERMQADLAYMALQGAAANQAGAASALSVGQSLLSQLKVAKAVGRLVIDLPRTMNAADGSDADIILRNGDKLLVPKYQQEVTVIGEVQNQTSHLYRAGLSRDEYIALSGGVQRRADKSRIYVVRANGSVISSESGRWFRSGNAVDMRPGDTIVVPLDTERMPALPLWTAVTQIIYNLAIAAAAVHSF